MERVWEGGCDGGRVTEGSVREGVMEGGKGVCRREGVMEGGCDRGRV